MNIGKYNVLRVNRSVDFGFYLTDAEENEVLLPKRYITSDMCIGDDISVFVYNDSGNRPVATTEVPRAVVGDFALMRVKTVNAVGAFLDWGLSAKDLLVPFREQRVRMQPGRWYIVHVYLDHESGRIVASAKLDRFLNNSHPHFYHRQKVDVLIVQRTELGHKVIVDNKYWGMIYQNETYSQVNIGGRHVGFIKQVRDDDKIDVTLSKIEKLRVDDLSQAILDNMKSNNGRLTLNDKSSPESIAAAFNCSKKDFKKALGQLYRLKSIVQNDGMWFLVKDLTQNTLTRQQARDDYQQPVSRFFLTDKNPYGFP